MSDPLATWRLVRGRHRAAIRLSFVLLAVGVAPTVLRALADTFAGVTPIGALFDALDRLAHLPVPTTLAAFAAVIFFAARIHPALVPAYLTALASTPWRPGRRLPLGDVGLLSSFVILPAATVALLWAFRQQATTTVALGATLAYAGVTIFAGLVTRHAVMPLALAMLVVGLIPATRAETGMPIAIVSVAIVVAAGVAQRSILDGAFGPEGVIDLRRLAVQKRSTLGWFENLPLKRRPANRPIELLSAVAAGATVAVVGTAAEGWDAKPWLGLLTTSFFIAGSIRLGLIFAVAPLAYGPVARVLTGRWFVWRMDRLLIFPLAMIGLIGATYLAIIEPRSPWNPTIGGAAVAVAVMLCWWVAPGTLSWQVTGASRILTAPTKQQKQSEANLKRMTDPTAR